MKKWMASITDEQADWMKSLRKKNKKWNGNVIIRFALTRLMEDDNKEFLTDMAAQEVRARQEKIKDMMAQLQKEAAELDHKLKSGKVLA